MMRIGIFRIGLFLGALFFTGTLSAQTGKASSASYYLLGLGVLVILYLAYFITEKVLKSKPLIGPSIPAFTKGKEVKVFKRGFDIKLKGVAAKNVETAENVRTFAVRPFDFIGISPIPKLMVETGDKVKAGDILFFDKKRPEIKYASPVSGEVVAINRGARRSIAEVVVSSDKKMGYREYADFDLEGSNREALVEYLLGSGVWPMITQRPFDVVPSPDDIPRDIFISTFDTAPLAPDLNFVIKGKEAAFQKGLDVLNKLAEGKVHLGLNARSKEAPSKAFTDATGVEKHWFHGKHPAGNVGIQIHNVQAIGPQDKVWTMGVQEVVTLGALFTEKHFDAERIIALTGAEFKAPKYVKTYLGANVGELVKGKVNGGDLRFVSGDVLSGKKKSLPHFLGFHDDQLTVLEEGRYFEMFGWLYSSKPKPTASGAFLASMFPNKEYKADTNIHGEHRAFVMTGQYEQMLPMDIYPQHLLKAIIVKDFELMEGLGLHELTQEDIALCEFACTSKQPLQQILREGLEMMRVDG